MATAREVFKSKSQPTKEDRRAAKAINFGLIYGISSYGLAKQLRIDNSSAKEYIDRYFKKYEGVRDFMEDTKKQACFFVSSIKSLTPSYFLKYLSMYSFAEELSIRSCFARPYEEIPYIKPKLIAFAALLSSLVGCDLDLKTSLAVAMWISSPSIKFCFRVSSWDKWLIILNH